MTTPLGINDVQIRCGRVLPKKSPTISIQKSKEDEAPEKDMNLDQENSASSRTMFCFFAGSTFS